MGPSLYWRYYGARKVQRRAALNDYGRFSAVSLLLNQLSWPTLQSRRKLSRLHTLHKVFYHQLSLSIPPYYLSAI